MTETLFAIDEQVSIKFERQFCPSNLLERCHGQLVDLLPQLVSDSGKMDK
jgi:hypothetical protein